MSRDSVGLPGFFELFKPSGNQAVKMLSGGIDDLEEMVLSGVREEGATTQGDTPGYCVQ